MTGGVVAGDECVEARPVPADVPGEREVRRGMYGVLLPSTEPLTARRRSRSRSRDPSRGDGVATVAATATGYSNGPSSAAGVETSGCCGRVGAVWPNENCVGSGGHVPNEKGGGGLRRRASCGRRDELLELVEAVSGWVVAEEAE